MLRNSLLTICSLALCVALTGCVAAPTNFNSDSPTSLDEYKTEKIAVLAVIGNHVVVYNDSHFMLVYAYDEQKPVSFEGIWEPEPEITQATAEAMRQRGIINAESLENILGHDKFTEYVTLVRNDFRENSRPAEKTPNVILPPSDNYFKNHLPPESLFAELEKSGYRYYVEFTGYTVTQKNVLTFSDVFLLGRNARLFDVQQRKIVKDLPIGVVVRNNGNDSRQELEANNLALLKARIISMYRTPNL